MRKTNISSGILRLCAAVVIAMMPLQVSFAETYHYENSTDYDSELYMYSSSEEPNTSSWRTRWEQRTDNNGDIEIKTYSASSDDVDTADWRSRWNSHSQKNTDSTTRDRSDWGSRWSNNTTDWRDELNEDMKDFQEDLDDDVSDWRTRWANKAKEKRDDWNNGHGNDDDGCDESNPGNSYENRDCDEDDTTRAEARAAINQAKNALKDLEDDIEEMEDDDEDQDDINEANDVLDTAQDRLDDAREYYRDKEYDEAKNAAEDTVDIIEEYRDNNGNDDDDTDVPEACMLSDNQLDQITNFPPPEDGPIVAFGDSLTAGVGASSGQDYVSELEALIGENIINAGVRGDTTEEALARLDDDVLSRDPRAVIVWLGGNDILARYFNEIEERAEDDSIWEDIYEAILRLFGREPNNSEVLTENETFANIEEIVERIQDSGAVVILVGIDGEPLDNNLSERYEEVADKTGAIYVDDVLRGIIGRSSLTSDFIHPNNAGYEIVAERIFPAVACIAEDPNDDNND